MAQETKILDGNWLAKQVQAEITRDVAANKERLGRVPGLGVILVGNNPASKAYVGKKAKMAAKCGLATFDKHLPEDASFAQVKEAIQEYNENTKVDGILLQLPLPKHLDEKPLLDTISPGKDADGLHPLTQGLLMRGQAPVQPCTPQGVMSLIDLAYSKITTEQMEQDVKIDIGKSVPRVELSGKKAVVIGRSILVGKPVSFLLLERNATVTMAHSKTKDLGEVCAASDIIVAAVGVAHLVKRDWVKQGAVVIDVGMNRLPSGQLTGDVAYDEVLPRCSAITPVPGGVGPMTVSMLLRNTLRLSEIPR